MVYCYIIKISWSGQSILFLLTISKISDIYKRKYCSSIISNIIDIKQVADIAHAHKIPLIVDNTFATPCTMLQLKILRHWKIC